MQLTHSENNRLHLLVYCLLHIFRAKNLNVYEIIKAAVRKNDRLEHIAPCSGTTH